MFVKQDEWQVTRPLTVQLQESAIDAGAARENVK